MADESDPIVTPGDVAKAGFCAHGLRTWCKARNLDLRRLRRGEVHVSELAALHDALADRVVANVLARTKGTV